MKLKDYLRTKIYIIKNKKKLLTIGKKTIIKRSNFEGKNDIGAKSFISESEIGFATYLGTNNHLQSVKIGRYCSIAHNLKLILNSHPIKNNISTHPSFYTKRRVDKLKLNYVEQNKYKDPNIIENKWNVVIGNDVWIGNDVKIMQGVKIGVGAVIGAGALVTKDVDPYTIVGGVPAKLIRKRFLDEDIKFLLELKWWDKGEEWIKENAEYFEDIDILKSKS